jgi:Helix-turn-helix domain
VDVKRAAALYAQGRSLRQIGAELGLTATTVSHQLRRDGVTMRRGAPAHSASTQQILELRDQGLTWSQVAKQVDMTAPVHGAATDGPGRQSRPDWADGNRFSPTG